MVDKLRTPSCVFQLVYVRMSQLICKQLSERRHLVILAGTKNMVGAELTLQDSYLKPTILVFCYHAVKAPVQCAAACNR
jgi:hypothetical protein